MNLKKVADWVVKLRAGGHMRQRRRKIQGKNALDTQPRHAPTSAALFSAVKDKERDNGINGHEFWSKDL